MTHVGTRRGGGLIPAAWLTVMGSMLLVQGPAAIAQTMSATNLEPKELHYGEMFLQVAKEPPFIFPLLLICSAITMTLIIERIIFYKNASSDVTTIVATIKKSTTMSDALTAIGPAPGIAGRVFRLALRSARDGYTPDQTEQLVQGEITRELAGMEKFLPQLDTMVTMCPLLGLAGTTVGMIKSFAKVAAVGMTNPSLLAGGISEALVNTAAGLLIAIPALFAYNWFNSRKEAILMELEKGLSEVMVLLKSS